MSVSELRAILSPPQPALSPEGRGERGTAADPAVRTGEAPVLRRPTRLLALIAALAAFAAVVPASAAAFDFQTDPFEPRPPQSDKSELRPGDKFNILVTLPVPPDNHLSDGTLKLTGAPNPAVAFGQAVVPRAIEKAVEVIPGKPPEKTRLYDKDVTLTLPAQVLRSAAPGKHNLSLTVEYQGCIEKPQYVCLIPQRKRLALDIDVKPGAGTEPGTGTGPGTPVSPGAGEKTAPAGGPAGTVTPELGAPAPAESEVEPPGNVSEIYSRSGLLVTLLLMLASGFASALLPCVYPLIPIVLAVIGARRSESRGAAFLLALTFAGGMVAVYTALGTAAGLAGASFATLMQSRPVVLAIAAICALMALSMFGAFEVALPASWQTRMSSVGGRGFGGAFAMGVLSGVLASACIGPILVSILALIASQGSAVLGFELLLAYSIGMGVPYVVLGATAASLPKPGEWMVRIKRVGGLVLLGAALWYFSDAVPAGWGLMVAGTIAIVVAVFAGGFDPLTAAATAWDRTAKAFGLLCLIGGIYALAGGAINSGLIEFPGLSALSRCMQIQQGPGSSRIEWVGTEEAGAALARSQSKPMVLDFRADSCAVCRDMESETFTDPSVIVESRRFVMVRIDLTDSPPEADKSRAAHRVMGLPTILFFDANGTLRKDLTLHEFAGPEEFLRRMKLLARAE